LDYISSSRGMFQEEGHLESEDNHNIHNTHENDFQNRLDKKMAPAANDSMGDAGIALNYNPHLGKSFAAVGMADFKDPLVVARAMIEEHQRKQNAAEEKLFAIVRARQLEARKEHELDLARAIRRHHEDEQVQKQLISINRKRELMKLDPELLARAVPGAEDPSFRSEENSRKRRLEEDFLLRNVLQRKQQDELTIWNDIQKVTRRANEDKTMFPMKFSQHQNMVASGASRLIPMTRYDDSVVTLPSSSSSHKSLSSRASTFLDDQTSSFAERVHRRNSSQFNQNNFERSQAILNSLYSSKSCSIPTNHDIPSMHKYYNAVNAPGLTGGGNLNSLHMNVPTSCASLPSIATTGAGADWLRSSNGGATTNSSLMRTSSRQQEKIINEGQIDLVDSNCIKTTDNFTGANDDNGSEAEGEQQQKRFNKHQCKQWTLKFHELLAFKERMGHCNVPHGYKDNLALAMWVKRQRHQYNLMVEKKTSTLTGERIKLLEKIGFVWNCLETAWEQHFQDLRHFVMRTGHCAVPSTYKRNPRLASWVVTQRRQCKLLEDGKQSSMTRKRLEKLKQIGFPVKTKKTGVTKTLTK